jgi:hypothetical protein
MNLPGENSHAEQALSPGASGRGDNIVVQRDRIGIWHGALERGSTGIEVASGCLAFSVYEIPAVPDFSSPRFPDLHRLDEAQRIKRVGERQSQLIAALHTLGPHFGINLRYVYERPSPHTEGHIRLFLLGRSFGHTQQEATARAEHFRALVESAFPSEYRQIDLSASAHERAELEKLLLFSDISSIIEILKPEQALKAAHNPQLCGFSFYYHPESFAALDHDAVELCRAVISQTRSRRLILDCCLMPTGSLTEIERMELLTWATLSERWSRDQRISVGGGLFTQPETFEVAADPQARKAQEAFQKLLQNYGNPESKYFIYSFRVLSEGEPARAVAAAWSAFALNRDGGAHFRQITQDHPAFSRALKAAQLCYVTPAVCRDDIWGHPEAPETLRRLHRMVDVREAAAFFRWPIPGRDGCPGIPLDTGIVESTLGRIHKPGIIEIGRLIEGARVTTEIEQINLADLTKHCLIVGTPGSGKTTLCFSLLTQLWEQHRIPFIVLEPAKTEYRALKQLPCFRDDLLIFSVGNEMVAPFRFNPFEVIPGFNVSEHISNLNTCFAGAFSMSDPLPMIIDHAIREVYAKRNWSEYGIGSEDDALVTPTLEEFFHRALDVAQTLSYRGEIAGNIRGMLETRLGALLRGPKGRCFNARHSIPATVLMQRPVIFEMDALNEEEKALMMMFLLAQVRAYAKTTRKPDRWDKRKEPLKHVVLVEEAHNVIGRGDGHASEHLANPQAKAIRFFTNMLAEMRALGEGIVIADQLPTAIVPEAIKTTEIKVMHRLVSLDDRVELGAAMVLDEAQIEQAAILPPGQSLFFRQGLARARLIQESNFKETHPAANDPPDDGAVQEWMLQFQADETVRQAYLPYSSCAGVCNTCQPRIREQNERWADRKWQVIKQALETGKGSPLNIAAQHFFANFDEQAGAVQRHCACVHFQQKILYRLPAPLAGGKK